MFYSLRKRQICASFFKKEVHKLINTIISMASYSNTRVKTMDSVNEDTANYAQDITVNGGMTTAFWQNQNEE